MRGPRSPTPRKSSLPWMWTSLRTQGPAGLDERWPFGAIGDGQIPQASSAVRLDSFDTLRLVVSHSAALGDTADVAGAARRQRVRLYSVMRQVRRTSPTKVMETAVPRGLGTSMWRGPAVWWAASRAAQRCAGRPVSARPGRPQPAFGNSIPGKILITALSSSRPKPAVEACMNIWCAVEARGRGNLVARAVSSTRPR